MDYASLQSTVASRLNRDDLTSIIPDLIDRAEDEIFASVAQSPVRPMVKTVNFSTSDQNNDLSTFASDFIDAIGITLSDGTNTWQLVRLDPSDPSDYYATRSLPYRTAYDSSKIRHYAILGSNLRLSDTPDSTLTASLIYFAKPAAIDSTTTNWILTSHADVYEFATLMHAARHIRDDELEDRMMDRFATALRLMLDAYPERQNPGELRAADMPTAIQTWNINTDV